ncbi:32054_t:CDS:2, partial [Gigaspora margarita]
IPKRVWQSNELDRYMPQDPQNNYKSYEPNEYGLEFNSEKETVLTSSNYYSELSITASGTRNVFNLMYTCEKQSTRISEYDENDSSYLYERVLPKCQKANMQDKLVGQLSDTSKSSKVFKFGRSLLHSPAWKWFEEIYIDKVRHSRYNIEIADKKPCDTKIKTGDSTTALWKHLKIAYGYSKMTAQQLKKQTTITRSFETFLAKPHSITEQAIHDRAMIEICKIVDLQWAVPSKGKVKSQIDEGFEQICSHLQDDLNKAETVSLTTDLWTVHSRNGYIGAFAHQYLITWMKSLIQFFIAPKQSERLKAVQVSIQAQYQLNKEKNKDNTLLKPYIEILASSLIIQQEKDAIADGKRLKAIMITEDEWTAVANIINILKPFNDITNYISGSSYPTISIIYLMMSTLRNALLKEFKDENNSTNKPTDFNSLINDRINIFDDEKISNEDENAEEFESLAVTTDLVKSIKKIMSKLFEKYYKFSDNKILFTMTAIDPRCKNFEYKDASLACQDYLNLEYDQMISDEDLESSSNK